MGLSSASHTVVVSDIHLADMETPHPDKPLWKKFKNPEYFIDQSFSRFLEYVETQSDESIELVLNGDIFDFDSVMTLPKKNIFHVSWLEMHRGLNPEERKSSFKIKTILDTHPIWVKSLRDFIAKGNRVVFIIGNHDIELHWSMVQNEIRTRLLTPEQDIDTVQFAEWFYISNEDTLIEHGNQYDPYSLCMNPVNPFIKKHHRLTLRIPFGNLAGKYMVNGMGLMNPHSENSYIKGSLWEYLVFFYEYMLKIQPLIFLSWFWGAFVTLWVTVTEGLHPAVSDPLSIISRIEGIAFRANASPTTVLALRELHAHSASYNPIQLLRELWLDRAILFGLVVAFSFQMFLFFNVFANVSIWFFIIPFTILFPAFIFYARSIRSGVQDSQEEAFHKIPIAAKIANVKRVIHGHTHISKHCLFDGVEYLNTGTWSPAFYDVECTKPYGKKCFAWIHPSRTGAGRISELFEWKNDSLPISIKVAEKPLQRVASRAEVTSSNL